MIIITNNQNFKIAIEQLQELGFIINSSCDNDTEVILQKENVQITINNLKEVIK